MFVHSDLNGFSEAPEARKLWFCVRYCCRLCILQEEKTFLKQFKKSLISFCNSLKLVTPVS